MGAVSEELALAAKKLRAAGVETPQLDAQLLMAHVLQTTRLRVIAHPERVLAPAEAAAFQGKVRNRAARYPLAYILGEKEFYGLTFLVTPDVLIPRPETEILVEEVLKRVGANARIADVGTGSGAIAVALAVNLPDAQLWATDVSEEALKVARANAEKHAVASRVSIVRGDLLGPLVAMGLEFDAVVSNPPYVASGEADSLQPEVRHEPSDALYAGLTGLEVYRRLFAQAARVSPMVAVEMGIGQAAEVTETARAAGLESVELALDLAGTERVAIAQRR